MKRLILSGDDLGMARSINRATFAALEKGWITSASAMVPAPYFDEVVEYASARPEADIGLHLTLTSENEQRRFRPVLAPKEVPSLVDREGFFFLGREDFVKNADPFEVKKEALAQIDAAIKKGLRPSHLDSHMTVLEANHELRELITSIAHGMNIHCRAELGTSVYIAPTSTNAGERAAFYISVLKNLEEGVSELVLHLGHDDQELRELFKGPDWGAEWRQSDLDLAQSEFFAAALIHAGVSRIGWKTLPV